VKPTAALQFSEPDHDRTVEAAPGAEFEIRLAENRTAGFRWSLDRPGESVCKLLEESFEAPGKTPGRSGIHRWRFKLTGAGAARIELRSGRPWETGGSAARIFALQLVCKK
jgi:predicted secreted protein